MANFTKFFKLKQSFSIVLLTSATMVLHATPRYDATTKEEGFMLRRITEFWKDQDYPTVKKEITTFLKTHKNSVFCDQLRGNYGDLLIQEGDYKGALESYGEITHKEVLETFILILPDAKVPVFLATPILDKIASTTVSLAKVGFS